MEQGAGADEIGLTGFPRMYSLGNFPCYTQEYLCLWLNFLGTSELSFEASKSQNYFFDSRKDSFAEGMVGIVVPSVGRYM